ncbi:hypothetical protein T5B8_16564, partial [Salinisphaera sp. T5B8]
WLVGLRIEIWALFQQRPRGRLALRLHIEQSTECGFPADLAPITAPLYLDQHALTMHRCIDELLSLAPVPLHGIALTLRAAGRFGLPVC